MIRSAEYIWLDGTRPTQQLRSKTRFLDLPDLPDDGACRPQDYPVWSFDGSSTGQSDGSDSDLLLVPVAVVPDPVREAGHLVLCEVANGDGTPHPTNQRAALRAVLATEAADEDPWFGIEQEFTLFREGRPLGFPAGGYPEAQGKYYCGVGTEAAFGRDVVEAHARATIAAGLMVYGANAEVMPGQWEFQIGHRGRSGETADPLTVCDHVWLARWLLRRIAEDHDVVVSFDPKPIAGDWNGAGAHTNFSTRAMRAPGGLAAIERAIERLSSAHREHVGSYGADLEQRLTGLHETCSIDEFKSGVADRGSSIRIPRHVAEAGSGYLEDRRPGANCDPYIVCTRILQTVCGVDEAPAARRAV